MLNFGTSRSFPRTDAFAGDSHAQPTVMNSWSNDKQHFDISHGLNQTINVFEDSNSFYSQSSNLTPASASRNHLEIFAGNLSYFCEEPHLYELFSEYVNVTHVRVMRSEDRQKSLMYAFIMVSTRQEVQAICDLLNGHLFMGRHLR
jgi:RNA recognition motif-containing protein